MNDQTLYVTGIGKRDKFNNLTLLLSEVEANNLIAALAIAQTKFINGEPPCRIAVTLHGMIQVGDECKTLSFVRDAG